MNRREFLAAVPALALSASIPESIPKGFTIAEVASAFGVPAHYMSMPGILVSIEYDAILRGNTLEDAKIIGAWIVNK